MARSFDSCNTESQTLAPVCAEIRVYLASKLERLNGEISRYPRPIARCDEQLTALLEQRAETARLLASVDDALRAFARIEDLLDSHPAADQAEQALKARLKERLAALKV